MGMSGVTISRGWVCTRGEYLPPRHETWYTTGYGRQAGGTRLVLSCSHMLCGVLLCKFMSNVWHIDLTHLFF